MEKRVYEVNAADFTSRKTAHRILQEVFGEYEYYGRNLNALYDVLTSIRVDSEIHVDGLEFSKMFIYQYADSIREVFDAAEKRDRHLRFVYTETYADKN